MLEFCYMPLNLGLPFKIMYWFSLCIIGKDEAKTLVNLIYHHQSTPALTNGLLSDWVAPAIEAKDLIGQSDYSPALNVGQALPPWPTPLADEGWAKLLLQDILNSRLLLARELCLRWKAYMFPFIYDWLTLLEKLIIHWKISHRVLFGEFCQGKSTNAFKHVLWEGDGSRF